MPVMIDERETAPTVTLSPSYMAGRLARAEGKHLGHNPHPDSKPVERADWFGGFYDEAHGVSAEFRAAHPFRRESAGGRQ